ncbi:ATP-binding protein [Clostridium paraputrificum]|uniref:HAMP domain-containing sensor histidine kinase n=1 Tax=Clostridium TaxID=1485 RepID=UPI003D346337
MSRKKNDKLLVSLFKYYITFVLVLAIIFIISYLYLGYQMSKSVNDSNSSILNLISGNYQGYEKMDTNDIAKLGGYLEILDSNGKVIETKGSVPIGNKIQYTEDELLDIVAMSDEESKYYVLIHKFTNEQNELRRVIVRLPIEKVSIVVNLFSVPYSMGKPIYVLYIKVVSVSLVLFIISITIYSMWTARKIKRPLKKIDEALGKVIEGDYDEKLTLDEAKEFVVVSNTINFLIDKLKVSKEENKRLEESKTRMLIDLSHDIKTPITTIRGFSAALSEGLIEDQEHRERYYETIYKKSERVAELVDDLFEFVKMDSVQYTLKLEKIDICEFLRQIVVEYVDELNERDFELIVNIPEEVILAKIDCRLFKRVITNLIENSIKYNPDGTILRVELRDLGTFIVIEVADNGIGIPAAIKNRAFDPFVRGDESRRSDGGSGLGLAIAHKIVENHGGEISLLDRRGNESTIFSIKMYKDYKRIKND